MGVVYAGMECFLERPVPTKCRRCAVTVQNLCIGAWRAGANEVSAPHVTCMVLRDVKDLIKWQVKQCEVMFYHVLCSISGKLASAGWIPSCFGKAFRGHSQLSLPLSNCPERRAQSHPGPHTEWCLWRHHPQQQTIQVNDVTSLSHYLHPPAPSPLALRSTLLAFVNNSWPEVLRSLGHPTPSDTIQHISLVILVIQQTKAKCNSRPDYVWKLFTWEKIVSMYASNLWFQSPEAVNVLSSAQSRLQQGKGEVRKKAGAWLICGHKRLMWQLLHMDMQFFAWTKMSHVPECTFA